MERSLQLFSPEYLLNCKKMSPTAIAKFLDEFRVIAASASSNNKSKLISIKIHENLLSMFRAKCKLEGTLYQAKIKELMKDWLVG